MRRSKKIAASAGALLIGSMTLVHSSELMADGGWYVSGNAGLTSRADASATDSFSTGNASGDITYDRGFGLSGAVGKVRLEGEISYRRNDTDELTNISGTLTGNVFTAAGPLDAKATTTSLALMANVFYDHKSASEWTPFVMVGVGGSRVSLDIDEIAGTGSAYNEVDHVFAFQAGAGVAYEIMPETSLNVSYRFFGTADPTFNDGTDRVVSEYKSHNLWIGLTRQF